MTPQQLRDVVSPSPAAPTGAGKPRAAGAGRSVAVFILGGVLGLGAGVAVGWFAFPHGTSQPPPSAVAVHKVDYGPLVATGTFTQPDPNDPLRRGAGKVSVYDKDVVLEPDFQVVAGPEFHVLLVPKAAIRAAADLANTMYVDLGPLTAFKGSQTFAVPDGVDLANYPSVVVWCRTYGTLISSADLSFVKPNA